MVRGFEEVAALKEVKLPRLIGSREAARRLLIEQGSLRDEVVVLNSRDLRSASPSSADEFVKVALVDGAAQTLEVVGGTAEFCRDLEASAEAHGVAARLKELSAY